MKSKIVLSETFLTTFLTEALFKNDCGLIRIKNIDFRKPIIYFKKVN